MKKLVIYYSLSGNTKLIATNIAETIGADLLELKPTEDLIDSGLMKYVWGGKQVVRKFEPELLPFAKDPKNYDLIFLGTPVWAFNFSPAINTFLAQHLPAKKQLALFCCHGGIKGKTLENMEELLLKSGNTILGKANFIEPLKIKSIEQIQKVKEWAQKIIKQIDMSETINFDDFKKVELRVAKIINAERVEKSDKLVKLEVDLGSEKRQVVAGIGKAYAPESLIGKAIVVVANLEPRKLMGLESQGVVLAAHDENDLPVILVPDKDVPSGSSIS